MIEVAGFGRAPGRDNRRATGLLAPDALAPLGAILSGWTFPILSAQQELVKTTDKRLGVWTPLSGDGDGCADWRSD